VLAARATFGLPYHHARMRLDERDGVVEYETRRGGGGARLFVRYRPAPTVAPSEPGTLQEFLVERYHLFVERRGRLERGQVFHPPYPIAGAEVLAVEDALVAAAGLPAVSGAPATIHYSPGVDVEVFGLRAVGTAPSAPAPGRGP
jgi:uncharacterized protein YqjF (DUF2071 family)